MAEICISMNMLNNDDKDVREPVQYVLFFDLIFFLFLDIKRYKVRFNLGVQSGSLSFREYMS